MSVVRLRDPKLWLALFSLLGVSWLVWSDLKRTSPGPISRTHASVESLDAVDSCDLCHGGSGAGMADGCLECHELVRDDFEQGSGLHGRLAADLGSDCGQCHVEHQGLSFPLVSERTFENAGAKGPDDFDHAVIEFALTGKHASLECSDCHEHAEDTLLVEGAQRFVGLEQDCSSCHEDPHEGRMVRSCASCHGQEQPFEEVASFEHERISLEGAHAGLACAECHPSEGEHSVIELGASDVVLERGCEDCHESEHSPSFLAGAGDCVRCHAAEDGTFAEHRDRMPLDLHAASGFALEVPHGDLDCAQCHGPSDAPFTERFPGRSARTCELCHADPHGGEFSGNACLDCHTAERFTPTRFGEEQHAAAGFPLDDGHAGLDCAACHERGPEGELPRFRDTPTDCASCHRDAHLGKLVASSAIANPADCATCHVPTAFDDVRISSRDEGGGGRALFDHDRDTTFLLRGKHREAECTECHAEHPEADENGRRFGFAQRIAAGVEIPVRPAVLERDFTNCATCHIDPHWGVFDAVEGGCASCHGEDSFTDAAEGFEHDATGFSLEGAHARAECTACHPALPEPGENGRTMARAGDAFPGPTDDCATCHADPHGGVFRNANSALAREPGGCTRCHDTESFRELVRPFEHEAWTGYPLSEDHRELACVACHLPNALVSKYLGAGKEGGVSTHGPVAGRTCDACHVDPHAGQFDGEARGRGCARCHLDGGGLSFDHQRDAQFALDEEHAKLSCDACHLPWPLPDGTEVTRYRPLGTTCAACHGPDGSRRGRGGRR